MNKITILSLDDLCPTSDLDDGIDEGLDGDIQEGTYLKICRGELLPIAIMNMGRYENHDLVSSEEAQIRYDLDPRVVVVPVKEWYQSHPPF